MCRAELLFQHLDVVQNTFIGKAHKKNHGDVPYAGNEPEHSQPSRKALARGEPENKSCDDKANKDPRH
jgi:hypothetical protein